MIKFLPIFLLFLLFFSSDVFAKELSVSKSSSFSSSDRDFNSGETVHVKLESSSDAPNRALNLRDNNYNLIKTYSLNKDGGAFVGSLVAPTGDGYYSLEAHVWGNGSDVTSVKTIKVGNANGGNVDVNIHSSVNGSRTQSQSTRETEGKDSRNMKDKEGDVSPKPTAEESIQNSPSPEVFRDKTEVKFHPFGWIFLVIRFLFSPIWPFV